MTFLIGTNLHLWTRSCVTKKISSEHVSQEKASLKFIQISFFNSPKTRIFSLQLFIHRALSVAAIEKTSSPLFLRLYFSGKKRAWIWRLIFLLLALGHGKNAKERWCSSDRKNLYEYFFPPIIMSIFRYKDCRQRDLRWKKRNME